MYRKRPHGNNRIGAAGSIAYAQIARTCPASDASICFALNVPDAAATSGTGDIFFQIQAPATTHEYVALAQGTQMAGANMFILYQNAAGTNVTISPRLGTGHMPPSVHNVQLELLEGSGIANGTMTANVRCSGCHSWEGGNMDFSTTSAVWIYASKTGTPIQSDAIDADISFHDDHGGFSWDLASAKGGSAVNPFVAAEVATTNATVSSVSSGPSDAVLIAHAIFGCLAVAFVLPIGGILIRVGNLSNGILVHQLIQYTGLVMYIICFGLGAYYASEDGYWGETHPRLGTAIFALMLTQPVFGIIHHAMFKKIRGRTISSYFHLTVGRSIILLGIINGGLGLKLTGRGTGAKAGYGVGAGIMGLAYVAAIVFGEAKRAKTQSTSSRDSSVELKQKSEEEAKQMEEGK